MLAWASSSMERASSQAMRMSTMRCCRAWKLPMAVPNCLRTLRYSSVISLTASIAPQASARRAAMALSTPSSSSASPSCKGPSNADVGRSTPSSCSWPMC
ncbi:hypothetical protein D9M70_586230 [compost metagenome]